MASKKLSPAMFAFAKANRKKLKQPTPAQKKIFAQYDAMVKAGDNPANPKPRPAASKTTASKPTTSSGRTSSQSRVADHSRPNQTVNGASLGSRLTAEEKKKREEAAASVGRRRTHRGGARASNNNRNRLRTPSGPKVGSTRRIRKGSKYVTQMWDGKKYITGNLGSKGAKG